MRPFLARGSENEDRSIVLFREELKRCGVFEGVDGILFGELFGQGDTQLIQVGQGILNDLRAGCAAKEEGGFGVLKGLGGLFVEGTFAARVARFAGLMLISNQ
jgi:hypothetical protein